MRLRCGRGSAAAVSHGGRRPTPRQLETARTPPVTPTGYCISGCPASSQHSTSCQCMARSATSNPRNRQSHSHSHSRLATPVTYHSARHQLDALGMAVTRRDTACTQQHESECRSHHWQEQRQVNTATTAVSNRAGAAAVCTVCCSLCRFSLTSHTFGSHVAVVGIETDAQLPPSVDQLHRLAVTLVCSLRLLAAGHVAGDSSLVVHVSSGVVTATVTCR